MESRLPQEAGSVRVVVMQDGLGALAGDVAAPWWLLASGLPDGGTRMARYDTYALAEAARGRLARVIGAARQLHEMYGAVEDFFSDDSRF